MKAILVLFASLMPVIAVTVVVNVYNTREVMAYGALLEISYLAIVMFCCHQYSESKTRRPLAAQHVWLTVKPAKEV